MKYLIRFSVLLATLIVSMNAFGVTADRLEKSDSSSQEKTSNVVQQTPTNDSKVITQVSTKPNNIIPAKMNRCPVPEYPAVALRYGVEGIVVVDVLIDENGKVSSTKLDATSGFEILDKASLDYFYLCTFSPAIEDGKAVSAWTKKKLKWHIEEDEKESSILGVRITGDDNAKPFANFKNQLSKECDASVAGLVDSMTKNLSNKNISTTQMCTCIEDKLFSDKILKQFFDKTAKEIRETYDAEKIKNYFMDKSAVVVMQCMSEEVSRALSTMDLKKK